MLNTLISTLRKSGVNSLFNSSCAGETNRHVCTGNVQRLRWPLTGGTSGPAKGLAMQKGL